MRRDPGTSLDRLHEYATGRGWWLELQAQPPRPGTDNTGVRTRLQARQRSNPGRVVFVQLAGRHIHMQAAAAALHRALVERE